MEAPGVTCLIWYAICLQDPSITLLLLLHPPCAQVLAPETVDMHKGLPTMPDAQCPVLGLISLIADVFAVMCSCVCLQTPSKLSRVLFCYIAQVIP